MSVGTGVGVSTGGAFVGVGGSAVGVDVAVGGSVGVAVAGAGVGVGGSVDISVGGCTTSVESGSTGAAAGDDAVPLFGQPAISSAVKDISSAVCESVLIRWRDMVCSLHLG
ncbi:MAG: hypothetical protein KDA37_05825 [Planctomycetales bacterium]|nr:hypothetical protein [Planctomycetales bacterium]